jgi:hypothetical protein
MRQISPSFACAFVAGLLAGAAACGGGDGDDPDSGPAVDAGPPDPVFGDPANLVTVLESEYRGNNASAYSSARAQFLGTGVELLAETMRDGNCRLLESDASYCEDCNGFCVGGACQPWPTNRDAGRITVGGLEAALTLQWMQGYYGQEQYPLPADLFGAGGAITASAPGAEVEGFSVEAEGVAPIDPDLEGACASEVTLRDGADTVVTWSDPQPGARVRLWMPSPNNGHGLPPRAVIECEGPDTGSMRIDASLTAAFPALIVADTCDGIACVSIDCPPSTVARYSQGAGVAGDEPVALRVQSEVFFFLVDETAP